MPWYKPNLTEFEAGYSLDGEMAEVELSWINDNFGNTCLQLHYTPIDPDLKERYPEKFSLGKATRWKIEGFQLFDSKEGGKANKNSNYAVYFYPAMVEAVKGTEFEKLFFTSLSEGNLEAIHKFTAKLKVVKVLSDDGKVKKRTYVNDKGEEKEGDKDKVVIGMIDKLLTTTASASTKTDFENPEVLEGIEKVLSDNLDKNKAVVIAALMRSEGKYKNVPEDIIESLGFVYDGGKLTKVKK